ncbi:MAG: gfo/Idh/MocA family oxidoreductase [Gemmatimonadales bacterium]|nr:MAG: gfo/Idh/MocA family oxidoreductase [Gemmatimonadales bacterium]
MNQLRFGVAGAGSLGFHHTRIARDLPEVAFAGFFDPDPARATEVAEELGVKGVSQLDDLLDQVDALIIASPTTTHRDVSVAALRRGIHVFIEKPIASTLEEADEILEAAEKGGALIQVGHVERFNSAIVGAEPWLEDPLFIESHRLSPFAARGIDVAVVLDLMIHDVDLVQSLVGAPVTEIRATGVPVLTPSVDIASARLAFEGGAVANLTASRVSMERLRKLRIFQPSGYLSLNLATGTGEFLRLKKDLPALSEIGQRPGGAPGGMEEALKGLVAGGLEQIVERIPLAADDAEPLRREQEAFRDAVLGRRPPVVPGREGRNALDVALSIESRILRHVADSRSK